LFCKPDNAGCLNIRFKAYEGIQQTSGRIAGIIQQFNPGYPVECSCSDGKGSSSQSRHQITAGADENTESLKELLFNLFLHW
jgi:hypothetical protein